ncbi:MAG TPA: HlyD family efflux transporter periplasmic adaptor subunit, partial [Candidatus Acidoferrum sp.]|nr:HlyD family efflux transporter periplasmic adaptor subunit [Candidatus Acidoferrum sp.]
VVSWFTFLFNFNPLIKLDGYYLLSDWLEISNLRQKAFHYLGNVLQRRILGWPVERIVVTGRERRIYTTYAVLAFMYSAFLVGYFFWLVGGYIYAKAGGPGLLLSIVIFAIIIRGALETVARGVTQHFRYMKALLHKPVRLTIYVSLLVVLIIVVSVPWCPHRISGEVAVIPLEQFTLSLNNLGLLESTLRRGGETPDRKSNWLTIITSNELSAVDVLPRVKDGQHIQAGDTIATLTSNQVIQSIASGEAELQRLEGQLALLKAPPKKEQVDEAAAQVRASQASYDQLKRDLKRSEELASKNLLAQDQLESARSAVAVAKADLENRKSALALVKSKPRPEEEIVLEREIEKQKYLLDYYKKQSEAQIVVSPIAGTVGTNRRVDTILTVTNDDIVEMDVPVSDFDILLVAKDQPVKAKVRSYPGVVFEGKVVRIPPFTSAFNEGQRFPVAVLVDNQQKLIRQGMTGYAKIEVGQTSLINLAFRKVLSALRVEFWSWW